MKTKNLAHHILEVALLVLLISSCGHELYGSTNTTETGISPLKSAQRIEKYIDKQTPQGELAMYVHFPEDWTTNDKRSAIVFFFGGGWVGGNIKELVPHAEYLAKRGMVTARADYRIKSRHGTMPDKCVEDGKSALRWLRANAAKLGIDPDRIAASGVSAGGHVAASTYTTKGLEAKGEETSISSKPNLLVLFEPVLQCAGLVRLVGSKEMAVRISPYDNLTKDITPLVVLCGMEDWLVVEAVEFIEKCKKLGIIAELYTAEGQEHGSLLKSPWLERAIYLMDKFLARYGYTQGEPTIKLPEGKVEMKKILPTSLNVKDTWAYTPLHRAARNGQKDLVKVFIANGADVNAKDNWFTPLLYTFRCGDKELVEFLIDNGADVNANGRWGRTPLYYAAGRGDKELIELFIAKGADVNVKDPTSDTPLHNAVKSRAAGKDIIELLITKGATLNAKNNNGQTPIDVAFQRNRKDIVELLFAKGADVSLHTAAQHGLLEKLKELIGKGTDINAVDSSGMTSLHHAVRRGRKEIVELLLVNGADINAKNNEGQTPVDIAANRRRNGVVKLLIEKGADVSLHIAVRLDDLAIVKSLIEKGADINAKDTSGQTPLHYAAEYGRKDIAELLIANGANVNAKDKDGDTPGHVALNKNNRSILELLIAKGANFTSIHLSAYQGDLDEVRSFIDKGVDVNAKNKSGETPLHKAAIHGHKAVVALLIDNGANVNARARWGYTPMYSAAWSRITEVVELLVEKGADINVKDEWDWTPLHYMAQDNYRDMAEFLIAKGADINTEDKGGQTPLQVAKKKGHTEIVELLRKHGAKEYSRELDAPLLQAAADGDADKVKSLISQKADVNARNYNGTVLQIATQGGHKLLVELLIRAGANVNDGIGSGAYALYYAAVYGYKDVAELLIDNGADVRARDPMGYTSLHFAASGGHRSVAELLIAKGADVNAKQREDRTPLHEAAKWGHPDVVELLVNKGANIYARDKDGRTPLWYAKASGSEEIVELLPKQGVGHDVAVTDIAGPASITQDQRASVIVNLVNKSDYSEPVAVTLTDVTDATTIGIESVHLSPVGFRGMDEICDLIFDSPAPSKQVFGYPVVCGDVNGDNYDDLLISAQMWSNSKGRAYLYYGGADMDTTPDRTFTGEQTGDRFSGGGGSLGDVNGDNYPDVILGAPGYSGGTLDGRAYIFYGGPDMDENADLILEGENGGGGSYGSTIVTGDLNNDSYDDVVVTAMKMNSETGRAYLYYGGDSMDNKCDLTFDGENAIDWFGRKAAIGGDVNGDGYADLIIGARRYPGGKQKGRAYLFFGGDPMDNICDKTFTGEANGNQCGEGVYIIDINNDGFADVAVGTPGHSSFQGRVDIYWGGSEMSANADKILIGEAGSARCCFGVPIWGGYVNNDNYGDLLIAGYNYHHGDARGKAYIYYGGTKTSMDETADHIFTGESLGSQPNRVTLGDVNKDGYDDAVIGGYAFKNNQGRVWLYYGGPGDSTQLKFDWDTTKASPGKHLLKATIAPVAGEEDTEDNSMTASVYVEEPSK